MYVHEIVGVKEPSQASEARVACPPQPHRAPETRVEGARDNLDTATPIMEGESAPRPRGERGSLACEGRVHQCARAGSVLPDPGREVPEINEIARGCDTPTQGERIG